MAGDWQPLVTVARPLLERIQNACGKCFDLKQHYVHLMWSGTLPAADEPSLLSIVLHDPEGDPYARILPGIAVEPSKKQTADEGADQPAVIRKGQPIFEILVTDNAFAGLSSYYLSKPLPDPLLEQLPTVTEKFLGPLFGLFDRIDPTPVHGFRAMDQPPDTPKFIHAVVRRVMLPEPRATIEISVKATMPLTSEQFDTRLIRLLARLPSSAAVGAVAAEVRTRAADPLCGPANTNPSNCKLFLHQGVTTALEPFRSTATTVGADGELNRVEQAMRAFIDDLKPAVASLKTTIENSPLTHFSFGLVSALSFKTFGTDLRVKIDGGKVINAPLPRALQMVVLNVSPWGYQSKRTRRFRPDALVRGFVGVVYAPDFGASVGFSLHPLPGLGVNVGGAYLVISRPESGLKFGDVLDDVVKEGDKPKVPTEYVHAEELRRDPLTSGKLWSLFVGVSYNFK